MQPQAFILSAALTGSLDFDLKPAGWWSIAGLAVFSTILPILTLFAGMQWIETSRTAIISTLEPVFTVICAAILFSETVKFLQVLGGLLVLTAIILLQTREENVPDKQRLDGNSDV